MEMTLKQRLTKATLASTEEWRQENDVEVKTKEDPNSKSHIVEITITAPDDYVIGQLVNKLDLTLDERRERPRRTRRRFWRKRPRS